MVPSGIAQALRQRGSKGEGGARHGTAHASRARDGVQKQNRLLQNKSQKNKAKESAHGLF
jgi:hypothetical protein